MTNKPDPNEGVEIIKQEIAESEVGKKLLTEAFREYGWNINTYSNSRAFAHKPIKGVYCTIMFSESGEQLELRFAERKVGSFDTADDLLAYIKDVEEGIG